MVLCPKATLFSKGFHAQYTLETGFPEEMSGLVLGDGTTLESMARFKISTPNAKTLPTPAFFLFRIHRRFANALHLFYIEDKAARGWSQPRRGTLNSIYYTEC